ncbi:MAG: hypothetical protein MUF64_14545 [Polyangiaceae bacterium]|nr:hypothetical protein [Polyangiaceae bacterium]
MRGFPLLLVALVACASASPEEDPDVEIVRPQGGAGGEGGDAGGGGSGPAGGGGFPSSAGASGGGTGGSSGGAAPAGAGGSDPAGAGGSDPAGSAGSSGSNATECTPGEQEIVGGCERCGQQVRTCGADGTWGAPSCEGQKECEVGEQDSLPCGNCGQQARVCNNACAWENSGSCSGQGVCAPGQTQPGGCDGCSQQECTEQCTWGACKLKPTSKCEWKNGSNFQCCGAGKWQFCSQASCDWFDCAAAPGTTCD